MGYTTEFRGNVEVQGMTDELAGYINRFSLIRHMKRDTEKIKEIYPDYAKSTYNGNLGKEGCYFIADKGWDFNVDGSVIDANTPPSICPGLWCQWIINKQNDKYYLEWDGGEKFYYYVEWLKFLVKHFLVPSGCILNGEILWQGEDIEDRGKIIVKDNVIETVDLE